MIMGTLLAVVGGGALLDVVAEQRGAVGVLHLGGGVEDLAHVGDGEHREAEFGFHGLHGGHVGVLGLLHAVHGEHETHDLDVRLGLEFGDDFAHGGAGGHHVVHEQHLHAVGQRGANHPAAVAVVLLLLAVEGVSDGHVVAGGQRDRGGYGQRNALISRAEHRVDVVRRQAVPAQEVAGGVGPVHLEPLAGAGVAVGQAHVVEHGRQTSQRHL